MVCLFGHINTCVLRVVSLSEHFHVRGRPLWNLNRSFLKILFLENWY